jgi:hypothetical protein
MIAFLSRKYEEFQTTGQLLFCNKDELVFQCNVLEPQWNENVPSNSCIPESRYLVKKHFSPKYGNCFIVDNVQNRSLILLHWGCYRGNTEGCLLVGSGFIDLNKDGLKDVISSRKTFDNLMQTIDCDFELIIASNIK